VIRFGVIGTGIMGEKHAHAYFQSEKATLVATCDLNLERAREVGKRYGAEAFYTDYREMLARSDLDAVAVATPDFAHREPVVAALEAGKDVIAEKPLATTLEDADKMVEAVRRSGRKLMVNFGNRMRPQHRMTKAMIQKGDLGELRYAYAKLSNTLYVPTKMLSWSGRSSPTWFLLSHMVDMVRWFFNSEAVRVYASKTEGLLKSRGIDTHDTLVAIVDFANGATACFETSWILPESLPTTVDHRIEVTGTKGAIRIDQFEQGIQTYTDRASFPSSGSADLDYKTVDWWLDSVNYFIHCLEKDLKPKPDVEDGRAVTKIILAMLESAEKRKPITLS